MTKQNHLNNIRAASLSPLLALGLVVACGSTTPSSPDPIDAGADAAIDGGPAATGFAWNDYLGAHYQHRAWARGGLRDPGKPGSGGYRPVLEGTVVRDTGLADFEAFTLPALGAVLAKQQYAVIQVGGAGDVFFDSMQTPEGRAAFAGALRTRVDMIQALVGSTGWESRIVFQFGNEIQNPQGFYGSVCGWVTSGASQNCNLDTEFAPAYVNLYLAPGVEALRARSQELFGRPDAIRTALGSVVGLVARRSFIETLLNRVVMSDAAATLSGQRVSQLVDTVTVHYSVAAPEAPAVLDDFWSTWTAPGIASTIRALWVTEEVGVRAASGGFGLAASLRAILPAHRWWRSRELTPAQAHLFIWGADVKCDPTLGAECLSVDEAMPTFHAFVGDRPLVETTGTTIASASPLEIYSFEAGPDRRVVVAFAPATAGTGGTVEVTGVTLDLTTWQGRPITADLRRAGTLGLPAVPVTQSGGTFSFSTSLADREVLVLMLQAN